MKTETELCNQQKTGSCEGCPVLYTLRDELRDNVNYDPRDENDLKKAALIISHEYCPEELIPDIKQLAIERKGNGWTGKYYAINVR